MFVEGNAPRLTRGRLAALIRHSVSDETWSSRSMAAWHYFFKPPPRRVSAGESFVEATPWLSVRSRHKSLGRSSVPPTAPTKQFRDHARLFTVVLIVFLPSPLIYMPMLPR